VGGGVGLALSASRMAAGGRVCARMKTSVPGGACRVSRDMKITLVLLFWGLRGQRVRVGVWTSNVCVLRLLDSPSLAVYTPGARAVLTALMSPRSE